MRFEAIWCRQMCSGAHRCSRAFWSFSAYHREPLYRDLDLPCWSKRGFKVALRKMLRFPFWTSRRLRVIFVALAIGEYCVRGQFAWKWWFAKTHTSVNPDRKWAHVFPSLLLLLVGKAETTSWPTNLPVTRSPLYFAVLAIGWEHAKST